jgi:hypothetical protein
VTWARLLDGLAGLLDDVPTRLAVAGLAGCLAASAALVWWASQHYVAGWATGWRWTIWEKATEAERRDARRGSDHEWDGDVADELDGQEVT